MSDPFVADMLADAYEAMMLGAARQQAEEKFHLAVAYATDWHDVWRGCRAAAGLAAGAEDFARARRWMNAAALRLPGEASPEDIDMVSRLDGLYAQKLDAGEFTPPRKQSPEVTPSRLRGAWSVNDFELTAALSREYDASYSGRPTPDPGRRDAALDMVRHRPPMAATICGRAVLDETGRIGIRDLTTGQTTLVDYLYADHVEHDAALHRIVVASGTLTGAGTDRKVLRVEQYRGERGYGSPWTVNDARGGLRITDHRARRVVHGEGPGRGLV